MVETTISSITSWIAHTLKLNLEFHPQYMFSLRFSKILQKLVRVTQQPFYFCYLLESIMLSNQLLNFIIGNEKCSKAHLLQKPHFKISYRSKIGQIYFPCNLSISEITQGSSL